MKLTKLQEDILTIAAHRVEVTSQAHRHALTAQEDLLKLVMDFHKVNFNKVAATGIKDGKLEIKYLDNGT